MEYNPTHYKIGCEVKCMGIAKNISFASIIYQKNNKSHMVHTPVLIDTDKRKVYGHFAKENPVCNSIDNQELLISFQGPHGVIDPQWYENGKMVPTWNYLVIHIRGKVKVFTETEKLKELLIEMASLCKIEEMNMPDRLLTNIVGFELDIEEVDGKAKLAQGKPLDQIKNVIKNLKENGNDKLAQAMSEYNLKDHN